jgi:hypothetical protein
VCHPPHPLPSLSLPPSLPPFTPPSPSSLPLHPRTHASSASRCTSTLTTRAACELAGTRSFGRARGGACSHPAPTLLAHLERSNRHTDRRRQPLAHPIQVDNGCATIRGRSSGAADPFTLPPHCPSVHYFNTACRSHHHLHPTTPAAFFVFFFFLLDCRLGYITLLRPILQLRFE